MRGTGTRTGRGGPARHGRSTRRGRWLPPAVVVAGLVASAVAGLLVHVDARAEQRRIFDQRADGVAESVRTHLHRYEDAVQTLAGYLAVEDDLDRARFVAFLDETDLLRQHDGMRGAGMITRVPTDQVAAFEARLRREGLDGVEIDVPDGATAVDVMTYNEPARLFAASWGVDVGTIPGVAESLDRATLRGRPTAGGATTLATDRRLPVDGRPQAFSLYAPVYADGASTTTQADRRAAVAAWAYSPFRAEEVLDTLLTGLDRTLAVELHDGAVGETSLLASVPARDDVERRTDRSLVFGGRRWTLRIGTSEPLTSASVAAPLLVGLVGTVSTLAVAAALARLLSARSRAIARAEATAASLRASERRFEFVAEHASDLLSRHTRDGRFLYASPAAERILGYAPEELVGRPLDEVVHPDDVAGIQEVRRHGGHDGHGIATFRARRRDGSWVWLESTGTIVVDEDGSVELHATSRDVSARRAAEATVAASNAQLRAANDELARSNAELADFAYVVSHDLSEPLRVLAGYAELLDVDHGDRLGDTGREYVAAIRSSADRLGRLIRDILDFSRAGSSPIARRQVEVGRLAAEALEAVGARVEERAADVVIHPLPTVAADPTQLRQLLQNLLANAVKFVPPGRRPRVEVSATHEEGCWRFRVADNGIGIPPDDRDRVFGMFARLHGRDDYEGTGVGLAIARKVVERHGGEIGVADSPLGGTTITFTLPDVQVPAREPSTA